MTLDYCQWKFFRKPIFCKKVNSQILARGKSFFFFLKKKKNPTKNQVIVLSSLAPRVEIFVFSKTFLKQDVEE